MKKEALENINSELFDTFNPEQELAIVGGTGSTTGKVTGGPNGNDWEADADYDWAELE